MLKNDENGGFAATLKLKRHPDVVIVDTEVIMNAPARMLVAGIGDAFATYYEAKACKLSGVENYTDGVATNTAYYLAKLCNEMLFIRTKFTSWIIYLQDGSVEKLLHENYKISKSEYGKRQKKKSIEGYHKQKLPSQNLYEVLCYINGHDFNMVKGMAKKSRLEHLFEQVEKEA